MTRKWSVFGSELGRSMIEMLGVLAIVGVLSIGGIAGFQKAMNKHKINQVTEELSGFINELLRYSKDWRRIGFAGEAIRRDLTSEIDFILPGKWRREESFIYDSMGNKFSIQIRKDVRPNIKNPLLGFDYILINRDEKVKVDLCMAYFNMAKSYSDRIYGGVTWRSDSDSNQSLSWFWGDGYCNRNLRCLKDLTLEEMRERCSVFQSDDRGSNFSLFFLL